MHGRSCNTALLQLLVLALLVTGLTSCAPGDATAGDVAHEVVSSSEAAADAPRSCCAEEVEESAPPVVVDDLPGESIYQLTSRWEDQTGAERTLSDFRGHVVVVSMIFTHCTYACPAILADLRKLEQQIPGEELARVRFLLVSFDDVRDVPERLRKYASDLELDLDRWTLLHGSASDVRELSAVLGVSYQKTATGDFSHASIISVLDPEGTLAHQQRGLGADDRATLETIARLVR